MDNSPETPVSTPPATTEKNPAQEMDRRRAEVKTWFAKRAAADKDIKPAGGILERLSKAPKEVPFEVGLAEAAQNLQARYQESVKNTAEGVTRPDIYDDFINAVDGMKGLLSQIPGSEDESVTYPTARAAGDFVKKV